MDKLEQAKQQALEDADFTNVFQAKTAWSKGFDAAVQILTRKHKFWNAGEPDCPKEIKAPNGELHTLRCKICGEDRPKGICLEKGNE